MAITTQNRGADRIMECALSTTALDLRACLILVNATGLTGAAAQDLNTVADIDALNSGATNIHSERIALTSESSTQDDTNNRANVGAATASFAAAPGVTAVGAALYDEGGGTDATRHLIQTTTTNFPQPVDGGLNVTFASDLFRVLTATA
jgi:hypothetical protein